MSQLSPFLVDRIDALQPVLDEALSILAPNAPSGYPFKFSAQERHQWMNRTYWVLELSTAQAIQRLRATADPLERRFIAWRLIVNRTERFLEEALVLAKDCRKRSDWTDPRGDVFFGAQLVDVKLTWTLGRAGTKADAVRVLRERSFHAKANQSLLFFLAPDWDTRCDLVLLTEAVLTWCPNWILEGEAFSDIVVLKRSSQAA